MKSPSPGTGSLLSDLQCPRCLSRERADRLAGHCPCGGPWFARYRLTRSSGRKLLQSLRSRPPSLWRFAEVLPVWDPRYVTDLGEGGTPVIPLTRLGRKLGLRRLLAKDESTNPTGSFKARGLSVAVSRAAELGALRVAAPSAGNAGLAMAAYAARAGLPAHVAFPKNVPAPFVRESRRLGAHVLLAEGSISDAGRALEADLRRRGRAREAFRLSTLKEPYRLEGKKTMGYELAPPWGPGIPDVVVYPTGGGTGLIGMWKAFEEMEALGWCDGRRPRMVSVQMRSCAPVVKAWERGSESLPRTPLRPGPTRAHGLRVPAPFADREILSVLRESGGCAVAVGEREMAAAQSDLAGSEGLLTCPEAAATLAALPKLIDSGRIGGRETVLLLLTGGPALYG